MNEGSFCHVLFFSLSLVSCWFAQLSCTKNVEFVASVDSEVLLSCDVHSCPSFIFFRVVCRFFLKENLNSRYLGGTKLLTFFVIFLSYLICGCFGLNITTYYDTRFDTWGRIIDTALSTTI